MQLSKRYILEKAYYSLKVLLHSILVLTLFHLPFSDDTILGVKVLVEFFVVARVISVRNYIHIKFQFCFSVWKHIPENTDAKKPAYGKKNFFFG